MKNEQTITAIPKAYQNPLIIVGPCAIYPQDTHPEQIPALLTWAKENDIHIIRAPYWKPRTKPGGFDGIGLKAALPIYLHIAEQGFIPATEIKSTKDAIELVSIFKAKNLPLLLWIGARRQDNNEQAALGKLARQYKKLTIMYKNQPWPDMNHTVGIWEYATDPDQGNAPKDQVILANRGYAHDRSGSKENRNDSREDLAADIYAETKATMIADPSHIAGSIPKVLTYIKTLTLSKAKEIYKGIIIEVHPVGINGVAPALTDAKQQLPYDIASEAIRAYRAKYKKDDSNRKVRMNGLEDKKVKNPLDAKG
jgi:chorismate mutase